jgi:hypothetical protein
LDGRTPVTAANQSTWDLTGQSVAQAQQAADAVGKQSAFILQAFTWGDNTDDGQAVGTCSVSDTAGSCYDKLTYPTAGDQLQLRNEVLQHAHAQLILSPRQLRQPRRPRRLGRAIVRRTWRPNIWFATRA